MLINKHSINHVVSEVLARYYIMWRKKSSAENIDEADCSDIINLSDLNGILIGRVPFVVST